MLSGFVFMPLLIRQFGLDDYGLFLLAGSLSGYLGLLDLGVGTALVKFVAEHRARDEEEQLSKTLSSALAFYLLIGFVACAILLVVAFWGIQFFKLPAASEHLARNLFIIGAVTSLIAWPASTAGYVLAGLQRYDLSARLSIAVTIGNIGAMVAVLLLGQGPFVLLLMTNGVGLLAAGVNVYLARRELGPVRVSLRGANFLTMRSIFRFSGVVFVMQVSAVLVYQQTDRIVLGIFVGAAAITMYEAAQKVHSLVRQLATLTASAVVPTASQLDAEQRPEALRNLFLRGTRYTVIFVTPIVVALIVLARPLLVTWLGPEFADMTLAAQIYVSYWLLNANTAVSGAILVGTDKLRFILWYTVAGAMANVILSVILVQFFGIMGVIAGTVIPYFVGFPIYMIYMLRLLDVPLRSWLRTVVLPTYPWLIVTAVVAVGLRYIGVTDRLLGVALAAALSVGTYWLLLLRFTLTAEEKEDLGKVWASIRQRLSSWA